MKLLFTPTSLPNNLKVQFPELMPGMCVCGGGAGWGGGPKEVRICSIGGMFPVLGGMKV